MVATGPRLPKPIGGDMGGDEPLRISLGEGMMGAFLNGRLVLVWCKQPRSCLVSLTCQSHCPSQAQLCSQAGQRWSRGAHSRQAGQIFCGWAKAPPQSWLERPCRGRKTALAGSPMVQTAGRA
jgi:hypothetical protein